ncbi:MAG: homoserine kinase [Veillonellaceae bacterium]|nr:homoserine kinase [Veillonellaceae bacterium]
MPTVKIRIPATTANLGSGFDVFGLALSLYNEAEFIPTEGAGLRGEIIGEGSDSLATDADNLFLAAMRFFAERSGTTLPAGIVRMTNRIPLARGLGSSSSAIVGGVYLANCLAGKRYTKEELLPWVIEMEGHPDNVAPALLGGFIASGKAADWYAVPFPVPTAWRWVVASPQTPLATAAARKALPANVAHRDAVHNVAAAATLLAALLHERPELLAAGFADYLHVPYRLPLIAGGREVLAAAREAGAYAATISGSGSTLLAICNEATAAAVAAAMQTAFGSEQAARTHVLQVCPTGVQEIQLDK